MEKHIKDWRVYKYSSTFHRNNKKNLAKIISVGTNDEILNSTKTTTSFAITPSLNDSSAQFLNSTYTNNDLVATTEYCADDSQPFCCGSNSEHHIDDINSEEDDIDDVNSEENRTDDVIIDENMVVKLFKCRQELKVWAIQFNIKQNALKVLLHILQSMDISLPSDPRTLLQTPSIITTTIINSDQNDGRYWHQGLEFCLRTTFASITNSINISININIDGLPIFKSSKEEFWPILYNVYEFPDIPPMIIGIYSGKGKPKDITSFIKPFVEEAKKIIQNGIEVNGNKISVKIRCFICDSPARAFIKGVANFNGQHGCQKCTTIGEYSHIARCNILPDTNSRERTDEEFRARVYEGHHKCYSPLEELPFLDLVQDFVVADSLHLLDLGIMKRCLFGWRDGTFRNNFRTKWCARMCDDITKWLLTCKMPSELHRAVRGLDCLSHWKGLEYRTFLYYIGIVILKHVLPADAYEHFLILFCAVTICSSKSYLSQLNVAHEMFIQYIKTFKEIYGIQYITSNLHNLSHVVNDVKRFGILTSITAYPFENKLFQIKKMLRTSTFPLAQVAKRTTEIMMMETDNILIEKTRTNYVKTNPNKVQVVMEQFRLSTELHDKWFLTNENEIVGMKNATQINNTIHITGSSLKNQEIFFEFPLRSSYLNIFKSNCVENMEKMYTLNDIKCKMIRVSYENDSVFIPLLHSLK